MRFQRRALLWRVANRGLQQYITLNNKVLHISPTRIWTFDCQNRADPIEITPFSRNFPDPAGSSLRRTGNTLILGLVSCPRNNRYFVAIKMGRRLLVVGRGSVRAGIARTPPARSRVEIWRGAPKGFRFQIPLIKPDVRISRVRLSDKELSALAHGQAKLRLRSSR